MSVGEHLNDRVRLAVVLKGFSEVFRKQPVVRFLKKKGNNMPGLADIIANTLFQRILTAFRNALGNLTARYHQRGKVLRAEIFHHVFQHLVCAGKMIIKRRAVDTGSRNKLRNGDILCGLSVSQLQKGLAYFSFCSGFHAWLLFRWNRGKCPNKCGRPVRENGAVLRVVLARFLRYDGYR